MTSTTFTYGTTPREVIAAHLPHKFDMSLNREDMLAILDALGAVDSEEPQEMDRAMSLRTSILESIGIEEV